MIELIRRRGHPVYLQIKEQIERHIAAGTLSAGQGLPSVRALAQELGINPNTVVRGYRELEAAGLVEMRHGEGTFVAQGLTQQGPAMRLLKEHARGYARASRQLNVTLSEAQSALAVAWEEQEND